MSDDYLNIVENSAGRDPQETRWKVPPSLGMARQRLERSQGISERAGKGAWRKGSAGICSCVKQHKALRRQKSSMKPFRKKVGPGKQGGQ